MLNVSIESDISTLITWVRVPMRFSFHDENSMVEASVEISRFAPTNDPNPISETGGTGSGEMSTIVLNMLILNMTTRMSKW